MNVLLKMVSARIVDYLNKTIELDATLVPMAPERVLACLEPADVLLVEGNARISTAIKYLTQSPWSHAAMYVGKIKATDTGEEAPCFVEADLKSGVRMVSMSEFKGLHTRICRPVGLDDRERSAVTAYVMHRLGDQYDLRNVLDLARYLMPMPPVPTRFRRRLIALGSGDPSRAICSTLIAQAFNSIGYPILPNIETRSAATEDCHDCVEEFMRIRHHSLYTPRDFDVSPYFSIIKPTIEGRFDFRSLNWST